MAFTEPSRSRNQPHTEPAASDEASLTEAEKRAERVRGIDLMLHT